MNVDQNAEYNANRQADTNASQSFDQAVSTGLPTGARHIDPEDLALYAMQFITGEEAATINMHIEHCAECRRELAQVQGDLTAYALSVDLHSPPPQVRQRVMKQIAREKKVVPIALPVQPATPSYGRSPSVLTPAEEEKPKRNVGRAVLGWSGWAIAAGLAVAAYPIYKERDSLREQVGVQNGQIAHLSADAASAHALMDALTDPKAMRVTLVKPKTEPVPVGRATYNADKGSLMFFASNLSPLQLYKVYELWLIPADGHDPIPAGTFRPDEKGNASVIMPDIPKGVEAKQFGITVEDEGGSPTPTLPIVMAGS